MDLPLESSDKRDRKQSRWRRPGPVPVTSFGADGINAAASGKAVCGCSGARKGLRPKGLSYSGTFESTGLNTRHAPEAKSGHDPFGYAQDRLYHAVRRIGGKGRGAISCAAPPRQGRGKPALTGREKLPEEGEEAGAGGEAVVGIAGEVAAKPAG